MIAHIVPAVPAHGAVAIKEANDDDAKCDDSPVSQLAFRSRPKQTGFLLVPGAQRSESAISSWPGNLFPCSPPWAKIS